MWKISYPLNPHCPTTKTLKQLIYNYFTFRSYKYEQIMNKMSHKKIEELYYNYNLVINRTPI